ncbi:MAG TPA: 2-oxo acid dehydrogenase subunit E2 [Pirellulales bacterium]|jgi:pyruvate dehydrogenase E2 component (dihydrolipoamide acetyltransferase)|nr:2-oxo acid dehydrogenase subunit E2 [Pirellulales bacterium]
MPVDFKVPDLGENIESGDIVSVLVKEGDQVAAQQAVFEVETGKAVVELPTPHAGKITKIHVEKGSKVKVGDSLLTIETGAPAAAAPKPAAPAPAAPAAKPAPSPAAEKAPAPRREPTPAPHAENENGGAPARRVVPATPPAASTETRKKLPPAGPATRRLARELGVDLGQVNGTGAAGRITEEDIKAAVRGGQMTARAAAASPASRSVPLPAGTDDRDSWGPIRRTKMASIRKTIAVNMVKSATTIPHVTNFDDADITELERIRKGGLADYVDSSIKLTMMPFVMKAIAQSLRLHPLINASVDMDGEQIIYKEYVNIGVAVDTERGLVVPVIRDVDRLSIPAIAKALADVADRARAAQFTLDEMRGSTFTISNMGSIGGTYSTPIINPPNVAILLVGRSRKLPVVVDDRVEPRLMMPLSLSYDHRIVDGATAARFLNEVINYLKVPGRLLLSP